MTTITSTDYNLPTYLCDYVKELIDSVNSTSDDGYLDETLLWTTTATASNYSIDTDYIASVCVKYTNNNDDDDDDYLIDYFNSSKSLSLNLRLICKNIVCKSSSSVVLNFETQFAHISSFITEENDLKILKSCFQKSILSLDNHQIHVYMSLLNIFVIFEKYLRQLVNILNTGGGACANQFLLRDLIANKALEKILSRGFIDLVKCMIGSPYSLNIRNLLWHGFLQLNECSHYYEYFLLLILDKIGFQVQKAQLKLVSRVKRLDVYKIRSIEFDDVAFERVYKDVETNLDDYLAILNDSQLLNSDQKHLFSYIIKDLFLHENSFIQVIMAFLPQIEFLLRKLYIIENQLDIKFNLSAQEKFFYLTMDEILLEHVLLSNSDAQIMITKLTDNDIQPNRPNKLRFRLGDAFMLLINDLFMYIDGPRIRDRLSHGEYELTYETAEQRSTCGLYAAMCTYSIISLSAISNRLNLYYEIFISNYKCAYHPLACIKYDYIDLLNYFELHRIHEKQQQFSRSSKCYKLISDNFHTFPTNNNNNNMTTADSLVKYLVANTNSSVYLFLYRIQQQVATTATAVVGSLQIINLIKHLIKECLQFLDIIYSYYRITKVKYYESRELRTRQRETFKYFEENCLNEVFEYKIEEFILFLAYFILRLHEGCCLLPSGDVTMIKQLRKLLSIIQNLSQQGKINRWLECNQLINDLDKAIATHLDLI